LLFLCKKDDKKHFSERYFYGELNTESTEKTIPSHSGGRKKGEEKSTEMLFEHGKSMGGCNEMNTERIQQRH
jgi:hypothetical protein